MAYTHIYKSPLGDILLASDGKALIGLWFVGQKYYADTLRQENSEKALPIFIETDEWLDEYFKGCAPSSTPKLSLRGSNFRKAVWEVLLTIPFGKTMTYGEIAEKLAKERGVAKMSARAVGGAVGHNPISLIVPCHRVVGSNGKLTGYAGGLDKKTALLELEGIIKKGFCPARPTKK